MSEKIVAIVAGKEVTQKEFQEFTARIPEQQQAYINTPEGRKQALTQYTNYFLFEKLGEEKGYDQSDEFKAIMDNARVELLSQYSLTQEVKDISASRQECEEFYELNKGQFEKGPQATARHILTDTEEEILRIKEEIASGRKDFSQAAREYSKCPSKSQGGSLGTFGRGQMVPEFDHAVFEGEVGKLIGPVKTQFGYHLIHIDALEQGAASSFDEVYPQIMQQLIGAKQNEKYMALRQQLIEKYGLEFME
ncbi:MAG: peptidylprolyl isomerase [Eubacterium sp.]|nr:peptidylprolyl isomerase [Eubacterium sp.]